MKIERKWKLRCIILLGAFVTMGTSFLMQNNAVLDSIMKGTLNANTNVNNDEPIGLKVTDIEGYNGGGLAIVETGEVYGWGKNDNNIASKTNGVVKIPSKVENLNNIESLAIGGGVSNYGLHAGAIDTTGRVFMWGYNENGGFGNGTTVSSNVPILVNPTIDGKTVKKLVLDKSNSSMILTTDNFIYGSGRNGECQLGVDSTCRKDASTYPNYSSYLKVTDNEFQGKIIDMDGVSYGNTILVDDKGKTKILEVGLVTDSEKKTFLDYTQLNDDSALFHREYHLVNPTNVLINANNFPVLNAKEIIENANKISSSGASSGIRSSYIFSNGYLYGWGSNQFNKITDSVTSVVFLTKIDIKDSRNRILTVKDVDIKENNSIAIVGTDQNVAIWGDNRYKQVENVDTAAIGKPTLQGGRAQGNDLFKNIKKVQGGNALLALSNSGALYGKGLNTNYELGNGGTNNKTDFERIVIPTKPNVTAQRLTKDSNGSWQIVSDNPGTQVNESEYNNTFNETTRKFESVDKYNKNIRMLPERNKGIVNGVEKAIDYGEMMVQYCDLDPDSPDKTNPVCKSSGWSTPESLGKNNESTKTIDVDVNQWSAEISESKYRKYRFYYKEVVDHFTSNNMTEADINKNLYTYMVTDLYRGPVNINVQRYKDSIVNGVPVKLVSNSNYLDKITLIGDKDNYLTVLKKDFKEDGTPFWNDQTNYINVQFDADGTLDYSEHGSFQFQIRDVYGNISTFENVRITGDNSSPFIGIKSTPGQVVPDSPQSIKVVHKDKTYNKDDASTYLNLNINGRLDKTSTSYGNWTNKDITFLVTGSDEPNDKDRSSFLQKLVLYRMNEETSQWEVENNGIFKESDKNIGIKDHPFSVKQNGSYYIVLVDYAQNTSEEFHFTVDCIDKTSPILSNIEEAQRNDGNMEYVINVEDTQSGLPTTGALKYQFVKSDSSPSEDNWQTYNESVGQRPSPADTYPNGNFVGDLYIRIVDNAGNIAGTMEVPIKQRIVNDTGTPNIDYKSVSVVSPTWTRENIDVAVEVWDDETNIKKVVAIDKNDSTNIVEKELTYHNGVYDAGVCESVSGKKCTLKLSIPKNATYYLKAIDEGDNETIALIDDSKSDPEDKELLIDNIDKDKPVLNYFYRNDQGKLFIRGEDQISGLRKNGEVKDGIYYRILKDGQEVSDTSIQWVRYDQDAPANYPSIDDQYYRVYVKLIDAAGNELKDTPETMQEFRPADVRAPNISNLTNENQTYQRRGTNEPSYNAVPIKVKVKEDGTGIKSGIKKIKVSVKNGNGDLRNSDGTMVVGGVYEQVYDTAPMEVDFTFFVSMNGEYLIYAEDVEGNGTKETNQENKPMSVTVANVDTIAPMLDAREVTKADGSKIVKIITLRDTISGIEQVNGTDRVEYQFVKLNQEIDDTKWITMNKNDEIPITNGFGGTLHIRTFDNTHIDGDPTSEGAIGKWSKTFGSDVEPPRMDVANISGNNPENWQNTPTDVTFNVSDNESGIKTVTISSVDGKASILAEDGTYRASVVKEFTTPGLTGEAVTFKINTSGQYRVVLVDHVGNNTYVSGNPVFQVTHIDCTPPTIDPDENITKTKQSDGAYQVGIEAIDEESGVKEIHYQFITNPNVITTWEAYTSTVTSPTAFVGYIAIRAVDIAGNVMPTMIYALNDDDQAPQLLGASGDPTTWSKDAANIVLRVSDDASGVKEVVVYDQNNNIVKRLNVLTNGIVDRIFPPISIPQNGTYRVSMEDFSGNKTEDNFTVSKVDMQKPVIDDINVVDPSIPLFPSQNLKLDIRAHDEPTNGSNIVSYKYQFVEHNSSLSDTWLTINTSGTIEKAKTFIGKAYVIAIDAAGNESNMYVVALGAVKGENGDFPTISIIEGNPTNQWLGKNDTTPIRVNVGDSCSGIKSIKLLEIPDKVGDYQAFTSTTYPNEQEFSFSVGQNGMYAIEAIDKNDNRTIKQIYIDRFDTTPPTLENVITRIAGEDLYLSINGYDMQSGITDIKYQFVRKNESIDDTKWQEYSSHGNVPIENDFEGELHILITDNAGNQLTVVRPLVFDTEKPVVINISDAVLNTSKDEADFSININDALSGVETIEIYGPGVVNSLIDVDYLVRNAFSGNVPVTKNGSYLFVAKDYMGNVSLTVEKKVTGLKEAPIDTEDPDDGKPDDKDPGSETPGDKDPEDGKPDDKDPGSETPDDNDPGGDDNSGGVIKPVPTPKPDETPNPPKYEGDINQDTDDDGLPDINLDYNKDGKPDLNIDLDGDQIPDINIDSNGDGIADINIDTDKDGYPDLNLLKMTKWTPKKDVTLDNGFVYDTMGDLIPTHNIDRDGDGKVDENPVDVEEWLKQNGYTGNSSNSKLGIGGVGGANTGTQMSPMMSALGISFDNYKWWYLCVMALCMYTIYSFGKKLGIRKEKKKQKFK